MTLKELNNEEIKQFTKIKDINEKQFTFLYQQKIVKYSNLKLQQLLYQKSKLFLIHSLAIRKNNEVCNTQILEWNERL